MRTDGASGQRTLTARLLGAARNKAVVRIVLTLLVVAGGIGAISALHGMDWSTFGAALAGVMLVPLAIAFAVSTLQVFAQLLRFAVVIPKEAQPPLGDLLDATAIGQLLNYATPLRSGDAYKLVRLAPSGGPAKSRLGPLIVALLVERIADVLALVLLAAWASAADVARLVTSISAARWTGAKIPLLAILALLLVLALSRKLRRALGTFLGKVLRSISSARFAWCVSVSFLTWALDAGTLWWTARSLGHAIAFRDAMQSVFVLNLGIAMPVTVGNIGVFEASLAFALSRHGIPTEHALAIATLEHLAKFAGLGLCIGILRLGRRAIATPVGSCH